MTKRQTRLFFFISTGLFVLVFLGLTVDTTKQVASLTHSDTITPQVKAGDHVWHKYNCINCHTLLGEGAYYAPDLTKIAKQRGAAYLTQFLKDPSRFYSEERDRRLMPTLGLSNQEISDVIAFLGWVSNIDNQGWPPRPILVSGSAAPQPVGERPVAASTDPVALGEALFRSSPPGCSGCHSIAPDVRIVGPSLANMKQLAEEALKSPKYGGEAEDVEA